jgi:PLP dependent protein
MTFNSSKYKKIKEFIDKAEKISTTIISISKNHPIEAIKEAISFGVRVFGENRVQEAFEKFFEIKKNFLDLELHLTGPLQTNKVKKALEIFDVFQTLDREKLAKEFYKYPKLILNKKFFVQVNIGKEESKSGVQPENTKEFIDYCKNDLNLNIVGLMCIPPIDQEPKIFFNELKKISKLNNVKLLSMGMSADFKKAIECGADYIRVGTALFGKRII